MNTCEFSMDFRGISCREEEADTALVDSEPSCNEPDQNSALRHIVQPVEACRVQATATTGAVSSVAYLESAKTPAAVEYIM